MRLLYFLMVVDEGPGCALAAGRECCVMVVLIVLGAIYICD